jgi:hypothetical protein
MYAPSAMLNSRNMCTRCRWHVNIQLVVEAGDGGRLGAHQPPRVHCRTMHDSQQGLAACGARLKCMFVKSCDGCGVQGHGVNKADAGAYRAGCWFGLRLISYASSSSSSSSSSASPRPECVGDHLAHVMHRVHAIPLVAGQRGHTPVQAAAAYMTRTAST